MRIDLHVHSTASDGTNSPAELMKLAADVGLSVVALTDHDTVAGWAEAAAAVPDGLTLVPGIEVSARWLGVSPGIGLHLLAYLPDPDEPELSAALRRVRENRAGRARRMVDLLRAGGIDVTWDEVLADAAGAPVGRPHLAHALIRRGLVGTVSEAFAPQWLGQRFRLPKEDIEVFEALRLITGAGGVPVFAHPLAHKRGRVVPDGVIAEMAAAGLAGLEADHPDHGPAERAHARDLAAAYGLFVTGSSDFHGTNKPTGLAVETTTPASYERILDLATGACPVTPGAPGAVPPART
ncbi:PHP domain-containing protein [Actinocatenispora rupis]|uniref:Phosphatase n=1 Tax=Actinocatenispora rupis TaxID=519421 RepID=A0A8J3NHL9_9ACTN|nr:PHP domain-containing protein [Actinocatenispora rupis]GID16124.1 phosphatase [Actinocatenispora rupis]